MGPKTKTDDRLAELDELTPDEIAENFGEDGDEHAGDVQPARPLRPGHSIGGFSND